MHRLSSCSLLLLVWAQEDEEENYSLVDKDCLRTKPICDEHEDDVDVLVERSN